jgi:hypothetical protein
MVTIFFPSMGLVNKRDPFLTSALRKKEADACGRGGNRKQRGPAAHPGDPRIGGEAMQSGAAEAAP